MTSVVCNVLERLIKESVIVHLENVTKMIDNGNPVDAIYLDFAKAWIKCLHRRLMKKLDAHGMNGNGLCWINGWLTNRKQRVLLIGKMSDWLQVLS